MSLCFCVVAASYSTKSKCVWTCRYMVADIPEWLEKDLIVPAPLQCSGLMDGGFDSSVMWFSSGNTASVLHTDDFENIHCVYRGAKNVVLINTTQYKAVQKGLLPDGDSTFHNSLNTKSVDLKKFPAFQGLQFHTAHLSSGDCIYVPQYWMHFVS